MLIETFLINLPVIVVEAELAAEAVEKWHFVAPIFSFQLLAFASPALQHLPTEEECLAMDRGQTGLFRTIWSFLLIG